MAQPSKTNVIVTQEITRKDYTSVTVLLEENIYDDAPFVTFDAKVSSAGLPYQTVFQVYNEQLARIFYREYVEFLKVR